MAISLASRARGNQATPDINVTPLVDVVLVLLIIFMVITPALVEGEHIELPVINQPDQKPRDMNPIELTLASNGALYSTALAEGTPAALAKTTVSTAPSNPTDSIYFRAQVPGCMDCATFHGDYINVSYGSDGVANVAWTDMREFRPAENGFAQYIYFARK